MLQHLLIENYTLIEKLDIDFSDGLSIITGETGAGKSIILGALSLILGQRADTQVLNNKDQKCIVEGSFNITDYGLNEFFEANEIDYDDITIIRREINQQGKSRAFINDTPVNLNVLKDLGDKLVDIHSQHKTLTLNDSSFQISIIDNFAKQNKLVKEYYSEYIKYKNLKKLYDSLLEQENQAKADKDYFNFLFDELDKANFIVGEQEIIENELEIQTHSEEIKTNLSKALSILNTDETSVLIYLKEIINLISQSTIHYHGLSDIFERLKSINIEFKDICSEIEKIEEKIVFDPEKIDSLNTRLTLLYNLQKKHRAKTIDELLEIKSSLNKKLYEIGSIEDKINEVQKQLNIQDKKINELAGIISENRKKSIPIIEKELIKILVQLGMPNASIKIEQNNCDNLNQTGIDDITFLFNANMGAEPKELSKVASGGELSRLMLAIKSLNLQRNYLPTIVFDEIDSGVSGEIADKVGNIIENMSENMQIIAITHLPQIASKGKTHFMVYKEVTENTTKSYIKKLDENQRITEIAKMLSGEQISNSALQTAKELLDN